MLKRCLLFLLCASSGFAAELTPSQTVTPIERIASEYQLKGEAWPLPLQWRYQQGDSTSYASPSYDDSGWKQVSVGKSLPGGGWRWYRLEFDLPEALQGEDLLLSLGSISVVDRTYVNGVKVGEFGGRPPNFVYGSTEVKRRYPVLAEQLKPGRNVIAVRVFSGFKGGMYEGPYTLQPYDGGLIYSKFSIKDRGANALNEMLFDGPVVQQLSPGDEIVVEPGLMRYSGKPLEGRLTAKIINPNGSVSQSDEVALALEAMEWKGATFRFKPEARAGRYECVLSYQADGKTLWQETIPFEVGHFAKTNYALAVDEGINAYANRDLPALISSKAMGRYGPREVNDELELYDDLQKTDARSGGSYSVQIQQELGAPRLFLANTRTIPKGGERVRNFHRVAGHRYDGLNDSWIYGKVLPGDKLSLQELKIESATWAKRSYRYTYDQNVWMDFSISALSPAWMLASNAREIRIFDGIEKHAIGLPTYLAYQSASGVKVVDAKTGIVGADMTANWVLAWFSGAEGWDEFDTPYLFVLEKRPVRVQNQPGEALVLSYQGEAGIVQGMPLYGVTLQPVAQTAAWAKALPVAVEQRCQYWSRVLVNAPDQVRRTALADFAADELIVKDEVSHLNIRDDWKTQGLKIVPISPTLALSAKVGRIDVAANAPTRDLDTATLHGPFVVQENQDTGLFRIKGLLSFIDHRREPAPRASGEQAEAVRAELNRIVAEGLKSELSKHPWPASQVHGGYVSGRHRAAYSNLLLALPYLDAPLRAQVEKEIRRETEAYFLSTQPPPAELAARLTKEYHDKPLIMTVYNPYNDLGIGIVPYGLKRFGIDQPYFGGVNVYMSWHYADALQRMDWLKENYVTLQSLLNAPRNSHDWATGMSWDSFSGLRVGNGHQESNGIYAAMVAMMRIARQFEDEQTLQSSAYYASMAVVGMQAQLFASEYIRQNRPWLLANSRRDQIEYSQKVRGNYFAEFNEFSGLSQAIISSGNIASRADNLAASSPGGLVENPLPEVMRLYQELWPDFINDFYDPKYDAIIRTDRRLDSRVSIDTFVYQIESYPQTVDEIFKLRENEAYNWWIKMTDYRAYLDYLGRQD